jgi:hypothetical protein
VSKNDYGFTLPILGVNEKRADVSALNAAECSSSTSR